MTAVDDQIRGQYDASPYLGGTFRESHPDTLRTTAAIAGFAAAPVTDCRVLEIGCAVGGNLLPMAQGLPRSQFIGIDISPRQIEVAADLARQAGLPNVEFRCQSLQNFSPQEGLFDYIIAHGVYSWIPPEARVSLLRLIGERLAPNGLAYVSYNTLPGWHVKRVIRDLMMLHTRLDAPQPTRVAQARQILQWASQPGPENVSGYKEVLRSSHESLAGQSDWYLLHEELEIFNDAVYFSDFVHALEAYGLRHLSSADAHMEFRQWLPKEAREQAKSFSPDPIAQEQYLDFFEGRAFRKSILCRRETAGSSTSGVDAVPRMYVAGRLIESPVQNAPAGAVAFTFKPSDGSVTLSEPALIAAFRAIGQAWPHAIAFPELCKAAAAEGRVAALLAHQVFHTYKSGFIELWTRPTDFLAKDLERPCLTPFARLQAKAASAIVTLRHESILLEQAAAGILPLMDGTRDRAQLAREIARLFEQGHFRWTTPEAASSPPDINQMLNGVVANLAAQSLLLRAD
jgi:SAM-dependent methyltransferase